MAINSLDTSISVSGALRKPFCVPLVSSREQVAPPLSLSHHPLHPPTTPGPPIQRGRVGGAGQEGGMRLQYLVISAGGNMEQVGGNKEVGEKIRPTSMASPLPPMILYCDYHMLLC